MAQILKCDDRLIRRWASGSGTVPPDVADWLTDLASAYSASPPPSAWRRHRTDNGIESDKPAEATEASNEIATMAQRPRALVENEPAASAPNFRLTEMSWEWREASAIVAKGKLEVAREQDPHAAIIAFEVPINQMPSRSVFENPRDWVVALLRRTMRA